MIQSPEQGYGSFNNVVLVTCGFVLLYVNIELLGIGYVMSSAQCDLELSNTEKGLASAAGFYGVVSTAIIWGYLSDRFGRRTVMLPALILSSLISILSSFSVNFWMFFILRILVGCLVSASSATIYAYLGELHTLSHRASAIAWCSTFIAVTFIWVPSLAWLIIPNTWYFNIGNLRFVSWRLFLFTFGVSGLIASGMLYPLPESPSYLLAAYRSDKALAVMAKMYAWNKGTKVEDFPVKSLSTVGPPPSNFLMSIKNMSHLTRPPLLRCVILSHLSMFTVFMIASGMYILMPDILNAVVPHLDQYVSICDTIKKKPKNDFYFLRSAGCPVSINTQIYPLSITVGVLCGAAYVAIGYVIGKICKIKLFMSISLICAILLSVSAIIAQPHIALFLFVAGLCVGCSASVLAAATVEVFPTNIRALAVCTLYMAGRLGAAVGANVLSVGLEELCELTILSMCLVTAGFTLLILLWPDPAKVRTEMEESGFVY